MGLGSEEDRTMWRLAAEYEAAIVTRDKSFALLRTLEYSGPAVVWIRIGDTRKANLFRWFETLLPEILLAREQDEVLIEVVQGG